MTLEELIKQEAHRLGQKYFPDDQNIWARPNYEAKWVADSCMQIANLTQKLMVERACEWLELHINDDKYYSCIGEETLVPYLIEDFRKAMEE